MGVRLACLSTPLLPSLLLSSLSILTTPSPALARPLPSHHPNPSPPQNVPEGKLFEKEWAVRQLLAIVDGTTMQENGKFFDWQGEEIEW